MEAYTGFAAVYDTFMDNVPYDDWCQYICSILKQYHITDGLMLDLGCGTGKMTRAFAEKGFDMIGVDLSGEMLDIAKEQGPEEILYLQQDMREFELYGTVRAIVSLCDSMNYLLEEEDLGQVLKLANNYLDPGGIFVFDMNTRYKYRELLGDTTICEHRDDVSFTWENYFDEDSDINEYDINLFIKQENGLYERMEEFHYQKAYDIETVKSLIDKAGMKLLHVYAEGGYESPDDETERVYFVVQECGKEL